MTLSTFTFVKKSLFLPLLISFLFGITYAQSNAVAIFDENNNMRSVELLNSPSNISECKVDKADGNIIDVQFDVEGKITGFNLKTKYKRKLMTLFLWFPDEAYTRLKEKEAGKLITLVKRSHRVRVSFYTCGTKAQADFVDKIHLL